MSKTFEDVKIGDKIICFDEYSHDYEEHEFLVEDIEEDNEGIQLFGKDLSYDKDEELCIGVIHKGNFVGFVN